ncbi:MAG: bifunctional phosphoglucose/phosphomannose isomerase [Parcubacteria group bacterium ADurb.Bin159]|jgi:glucose/mannose-6-phosphate isomerase|nr:MAG: bifunctional phosphoglucose/phosphomannose isomerase [Parcubacteria group bacterium ADurb.Bin159]
MFSLDNQRFIKSLDKKNLASVIEQWPNYSLKILEKAQKELSIPQNWVNKGKNVCFYKIIVNGMGGSGIVGDVAKLVANPRLPFIVFKNNKIDSVLDENTLFIPISFSGNTNEVLICLKMALSKKAKIFIITSNGKLLKLAKTKKIPFFQIKHPGPPRLALGPQLVPLLILLEKLHLFQSNHLIPVLKKNYQVNKKFSPPVLSKKNLAKQIAFTLFNYLPIIATSSKEKVLGERWMTQFHENSKNFAFNCQWPEIFHNLVEANLPQSIKEKLFFIILSSKNENYIKKLTFSFREKQISYLTIIGQGKNYLEKIFYLITLGDWVSYYLAILNNVDPTPVKHIERLKKLDYRI